jgi:hypothetical protein
LDSDHTEDNSQPATYPEYSEYSELKPPEQDKVLALCGYAFVMASVFCFGTIAFLKIQESFTGTRSPRAENMFDLLQRESTAVALLIIAIVAAFIGKSLLTSVRLANARTIPYEDLPLIRQAVIDGKTDPIDQYVRLRALSGMSGTFTKLGITGLPLTTVALTLIFSMISLLPIGPESSKSFLDLAKLTLGAFIGSFVQGKVEQRRQERDDASNMKPRPKDLIA